jgi:hypothetical protein
MLQVYQEINMSDKSTSIKADNNQITVVVDEFDSESIWLSIRGNHGGSHCTIAKNDARKMMEAIQRLLEESCTES